MKEYRLIRDNGATAVFTAPSMDDMRYEAGEALRALLTREYGPLSTTWTEKVTVRPLHGGRGRRVLLKLYPTPAPCTGEDHVWEQIRTTPVTGTGPSVTRVVEECARCGLRRETVVDNLMMIIDMVYSRR